ncbi:MAG: MarR family winged helix-turn-helix transcriptional regulator [Christensenellales bacterium]|jgi:DNA-binding MarR family transcriptional regulator
MTEQEIRALLNQVLKNLFYKILRLQEKSVSKSSNDTISRTEMHIMESIQNMPQATLTNIAEELGITKATASVSVSRLAEKSYVKKIQSDKDKRISILKLTDKGLFCCKKHAQFHEMMIESLLKEFNIKEYPDLLKSFQLLLNFFSRLEES